MLSLQYRRIIQISISLHLSCTYTYLFTFALLSSHNKSFTHMLSYFLQPCINGPNESQYFTINETHKFTPNKAEQLAYVFFFLYHFYVYIRIS